ncbi:MAG TPA: 3-keto-5-aminohexanoate cleavage protein [Burkholderiales bacterium]|nr:3-keto-5-aminohexanoate cleavage protein [Burkholderiales bacterium]
MTPLVIEAALNGITPKARNPRVPVAPEEIAADALACLEAGAAIVHSHVDSYALRGEAAVKRYLEGWAPVLAAKRPAILYGTIASGETPQERFGHYRALAGAGMRMCTVDPGSVNLGTHGEDGLPGPGSYVYRTSFEDIAAVLALARECRLGPSLAVYEPGFLRTVLAYERAGRLPPGALVKLYFGGPYNFLDGRRSPVTFGLPPTRKALDAYLELLEGSALPWAVAVLGGCVVRSGLARLALERGGHVRAGLEDYAGEARPANAELVAEVAALARACGRAVASPAQAADLLGLPAR